MTPQTLADDFGASACLNEYANALNAEVESRATVEAAEWLLKIRESVPWTMMSDAPEGGALINAKNEQGRDAQYLQWCVADLDHPELRNKLTAAKSAHRRSLALIEVSRERVRTTRALILASAPDRGYA